MYKYHRDRTFYGVTECQKAGLSKCQRLQQRIVPDIVLDLPTMHQCIITSDNGSRLLNQRQ